MVINKLIFGSIVATWHANHNLMTQTFSSTQNLKKTILFFLLSFLTCFAFSQTYTFHDPVLVSGINGADSAVYRFANVSAGTDALITINKRSSSLVTLDTVDMTSTGYWSAFQPMVTYNGGNVAGPINWWMEFNIAFVQSGTSTPIIQDSIYATAIDVDGDGSSLQEQFTDLSSGTYTQNVPSSLLQTAVSDTIGLAGTPGTITNGSMFTGPTANAPGIDTTNKYVMVTMRYMNVSSITIRYGGQIAGSGSTSAGGRMNSLWFQKFNYLGIIGILPVTIKSFNAQLSGRSNVMLNWSVSSEVNTSHFEVERSTDGLSFDESGIVMSDANSNVDQVYSFNDNISMVTNGLIYYRLKIVDIDGTYKYSDVAVVRTEKEHTTMNAVAYPNPAVNELRVTIPDSWQAQTVSYSIYNLSGSLVKLTVNSNAAQTQTMDISALAMGSYIIKASSGKEVSVQKFLKTL